MVCFVNIQCIYENYNYNYTKKRFDACKSQNKFNSTHMDLVLIDSATGMENWNKTNDDVNEFYATASNLYFFPKGLDKVFKNLKIIDFRKNKIQIIHRSDLRPFRKLIMLYMAHNRIEILVEGLFDFNLDLLYINFDFNDLFMINENVFEKLKQLEHLNLEHNICIDALARNRSMVITIMQTISQKCKRSDYNAFIKGFNISEDDSKSSDYDDVSLMMYSKNLAIHKMMDEFACIDHTNNERWKIVIFISCAILCLINVGFILKAIKGFTA